MASSSSSSSSTSRRRGGRARQEQERPLWDRFRQQVPRRTFVSHRDRKFQYYDAIPDLDGVPRTKRRSTTTSPSVDKLDQEKKVGQDPDVGARKIFIDRGRGKSRMETAKDEETLVILPDLFGTAAVFYKQVMALSAQVRCCRDFSGYHVCRLQCS